MHAADVEMKRLIINILHNMSSEKEILQIAANTVEVMISVFLSVAYLFINFSNRLFIILGGTYVSSNTFKFK